MRLNTLHEANMAEQKPVINWTKPDIRKEVEEYFGNEVTKEFLKEKGFEFKDTKTLLNVLAKGTYATFGAEDRKYLQKNAYNMTLTDEDFEDELKDPEYAKSFNSMRNKLLNNKEISLPSPILLKVDGEYWGFAGNRRSNLAWSNGLPVKFYIVDLDAKGEK